MYIYIYTCIYIYIHTYICSTASDVYIYIYYNTVFVFSYYTCLPDVIDLVCTSELELFDSSTETSKTFIHHFLTRRLTDEKFHSCGFV